MREDDQLDRILKSALSNYGDPGMDAGLAERILAHVSSEQSSNHSAPRWRSRLVLWTALPAAACLLIILFVLKFASPVTQQSARTLQSSSTTNNSQAHGAASIASAPKTPLAIRRTQRGPVAVARSAPRPKLDLFPQPQPLSPEEQALYALAMQTPEKQRDAVLGVLKNDDAPLNVAALRIQPLEIPDTGKK
jgi:hypothetical protein